jgi:serine/threonine-protein kinase
MTTPLLAEGTLFAGRYRILRRIAAGGMGDVYEVLHLETNRRRALKVMQAHILTSDRMRERFRREARITAEIDSEFLVDIFDAGVDDETSLPFLVMELLRGKELKKHIESAGAIAPTDVVLYLHQTALALDKTHKANIVHRDLKPDNLFLTEREDGSPRIKVLDFGIAKILAHEGAHPHTTHEMMGTPLYMAPEQFRAAASVTPAADIYSLGMIAYTCLVGATYWKDELNAGMSALVFIAIAMSGPQELASARARRRGVPLPPAFDAWFAEATAVSPEARFQSALGAISALADALGVARSGRPAASNNARYAAARSARGGGTIPMVPRPVLPHTAHQPLKPPAPAAKTACRAPAVGALLLATAPLGGDDTLINSFSSAKTLPLGIAARDRRVAGIAGIVAITSTALISIILISRASHWRQGSERASSNKVLVAESVQVSVSLPPTVQLSADPALETAPIASSKPSPPAKPRKAVSTGPKKAIVEGLDRNNPFTASPTKAERNKQTIRPR